MQTRKKKSNAAAFWVILAVVLAAALGVAIYFGVISNWFTQSMRVYENGYELKNGQTGVRVGSGYPHEFVVKSATPESLPPYDVRIFANTETGFFFTVDGNPQAFIMLGDVTDCFAIEQNESGFTVELPRAWSMEDVLRSVYPEAQIEISGELNDDADYFTLAIVFENGELFTCTFSLFAVATDGVVF